MAGTGRVPYWGARDESWSRRSGLLLAHIVSWVLGTYSWERSLVSVGVLVRLRFAELARRYDCWWRSEELGCVEEEDKPLFFPFGRPLWPHPWMMALRGFAPRENVLYREYFHLYANSKCRIVFRPTELSGCFHKRCSRDPIFFSSIPSNEIYSGKMFPKVSANCPTV